MKEKETSKTTLGLTAFESLEKSLNSLRLQVCKINAARNNHKADKLGTLLTSLFMLKQIIHDIHLATEISLLCANDLDSTTLLYHTIKQRKAGFEVRTDWESQIDELIKDVQLMIEAAK